jgi:hypothetical protein
MILSAIDTNAAMYAVDLSDESCPNASISRMSEKHEPRYGASYNHVARRMFISGWLARRAGHSSLCCASTSADASEDVHFPSYNDGCYLDVLGDTAHLNHSLTALGSCRTCNERYRHTRSCFPVALGRTNRRRCNWSCRSQGTSSSEHNSGLELKQA